MKTFVITLPSGKDRQEKIKEYFKNCNINFNFYDGVSRDDIVFLQDPSFIIKDKLIKINEINLKKYTNRMWVRFGEIGALMAHKNIWDKLINDENEIVYLICEDDCKPSDLFDITLLNSFDYSKIDLLYLQAITAHHQDKQLLVNQYKETNWDKNLKIIDKHKGLMCEGFAAYCITKQGAKKLCEYIETNGYDGPIDNLVTHVDNFTCVCPSNIKNYFYLNEIADYSFTHSGTFTFNYKLNNIELQSQNQLKIKNKG